jgi:imidazolonepropionase-like amidohydrolase
MEKTLIRGAMLIDGTGGPVVEPAVLLTARGVIEAVGEEAATRAAEASEIWDCSDQTLLPGLIDCHNHLSLDPTLDNYLHRMNDPLPELTLRAVNSMKVDLMAGVTTSRCLGDKGFLDIACRKASAAGTLLGPRLLVATRGIRAPHGHGFVGYPFGGVEKIRSAVRENLQAGADLIKVYITGTLRGPRQILHFYSREEIQAVVDEAHRVGVPVATHCIGGPGLRLALEAGIDVIEHGYFMTDQEIELVGQYDRWLVMTPSIFFADARIRTLPPELIEGHLRQRGRHPGRRPLCGRHRRHARGPRPGNSLSRRAGSHACRRPSGRHGRRSQGMRPCRSYGDAPEGETGRLHRGGRQSAGGSGRTRAGPHRYFAREIGEG